jgi:hypothetical protein
LPPPKMWHSRSQMQFRCSTIMVSSSTNFSIQIVGWTKIKPLSYTFGCWMILNMPIHVVVGTFDTTFFQLMICATHPTLGLGITIFWITFGTMVLNLAYEASHIYIFTLWNIFIPYETSHMHLHLIV